MKIKYIIWVVIVIVSINRMLIYIIPIDKNELIGKYESKYQGIIYKLELEENGHCIMISFSEDKQILENEICKEWKVGTVNYRALPINTISCNMCQEMDFTMNIDRDFFGIKIDNPGSSFKRIDGDNSVYFRKIYK